MIALPTAPRPVPPLVVDPAGIRSCASDLLAASAQVDDLGSFTAGGARVAGWTGIAASAYHAAIGPTGRRADAMSLALRQVSRRLDQHADTMQALADRRTVLVDARRHLLDTRQGLAQRAHVAVADEAPFLRAECDECTRGVRRHDAELDTWLAEVVAEEEAVRATLDRLLTVEQVEQRYAGVPDPADAALDELARGRSAFEVHAWWTGLSEAEQQAVIAASPGSVGNRDGVPAAARDAANTLALERDLADWGHLEALGLLTPDEEQWLGNARAAQQAVTLVGDGDDPVTGLPVAALLHTYDPTAFDGDGAVAVSAGDVGTADNVSVLVPGFGTDARSAPYQAERALVLHEAARALDGSRTNASMFWIGYDAPDNAPWDGGWDGGGVVGEDLATRGGERLADTLDGLRAARGGEAAHLTVIGHSYGSTTTGHAAHDHGIPVDDVVFVGSPGVGGGTEHAAETGVDPDHVWAAANSRDPIANLGNHGSLHLETFLGGGLGDDPAEDDFGAQRFRAESTTRADNDGLAGLGDHSKYFDHDTESLYNITQVVNGNYDAVVLAGHVHDPWLGDPHDPEWDRRPTAPDTDLR